jgi:DNA invertase Pin-like site-specific DNA recombinase
MLAAARAIGSPCRPSTLRFRAGCAPCHNEKVVRVKPDDVLMVTRIDRLARSIGDLQDIVRAVRAKGASLATEQPIDTSTAAGKCFLDMLGVFAKFETNLRRDRQLEGIAKAKAAGVYKGRPASIDAAQVRAMKAQGLGGLGNRKGPQDRPGIGLSGAGGQLIGGLRLLRERRRAGKQQ